MLYIRLLFALFATGVFTYLNQLHHSAIFVRQDVTVLYIQASKIDEASPHLEITAHWDCKGIPPHVRRLEHQRRSHRSRIEDLNDLERIDMNVERMRDAIRHILVFDFPLLRITQFHRLINVPVLELPVVNSELI